MEAKVLHFHFADYIVTGVFLLVSLGIGIYYGVMRRQTTKEEYLLGNRRMQLIPITISMLVTYQSAISVLGIPAEVYVYDTMIYYLLVGIAISNLLSVVTIVPLLHPLGLTSAYEYLERRFNSKLVQLLGTFMGMLQTVIYMSIVLYAPSLAIEAVAGIPLWMSVLVAGAIGTIYTSLGGIKSVVWTDVFQFLMLYGGLAAILAIGSSRVGGMNKAIWLAQQGGRTNLSSDGIDPRVRHTLWGLIIGGMFSWIPNCCNQSIVQRISAIRTLKHAQLAMFLNAPIMMIFGAVLVLTGMLLYSYFTLEACGPLEYGFVGNMNQLMPYFVMHVLHDYPGLAGVFLAALFSGSMSSLSSGINSLAANTVQDLLGRALQGTSEYRITLLAKISVLFYGATIIGLALLAQNFTGPVTQIAMAAFGATGGPVSGLFFLGAIFPQANWVGAFAGGILSIAINMWISIGTILYGKKSLSSPPVPVSGCAGLEYNSTWLSKFSDSTTVYILRKADETSTSSVSHRSLDTQPHLEIYNISYIWLGMTGFLLSISLGLLVSVISGGNSDGDVGAQYIFPFLRKVWGKRLSKFNAKLYKYGEHIPLPQGEKYSKSCDREVDITPISQ